MYLNDLVKFIGCSEINFDLVELLASADYSIQNLPQKKIRSQGVEGVDFPSIGLSLTFKDRTAYETRNAPAKDAGKAILAAVFAYGSGSEVFAPYAGPIPFSSGAIVNRTDALRELGPPLKTEVDEDDGIIEWDQWIKGELQLRAEYRADGSLIVFSFSTPLQ